MCSGAVRTPVLPSSSGVTVGYLMQWFDYRLLVQADVHAPDAPLPPLAHDDCPHL